MFNAFSQQQQQDPNQGLAAALMHHIMAAQMQQPTHHFGMDSPLLTSMHPGLSHELMGGDSWENSYPHLAAMYQSHTAPMPLSAAPAAAATIGATGGLGSTWQGT